MQGEGVCSGKLRQTITKLPHICKGAISYKSYLGIRSIRVMIGECGILGSEEVRRWRKASPTLKEVLWGAGFVAEAVR
jgi:hypothetical protein